MQRRDFLKNSAQLVGALSAVSAAPIQNAFAFNNLKNALDSRNVLASNNIKNALDSSNALDSKAKNNAKGEKMTTQVWYITGASGGLGFALAKYLLEKGDKVAATSRKKGIEEKFKGLATADNFLPLVLNFEKQMDAQIAENLAQVQEKFARLDNVVNNAGYGLLGFVEEVSESQLREQFEVNVFAPFLVVQNALKIMRPQAKKEGGQSGNVKARIYNLSSIGGFRVSNVSTPYCMSKFAISALSEGLNLDLEDFGIATINIMPAGFRTEFVGTSLNLGKLKIADYEEKRQAFESRTRAYNGKQAGDPAHFAQIIFETSRMATPPRNLFMGDAAYQSARNKIAAIEKDMATTETYAGAAADFPGSSGSAFDKR